MLLQYTDEETFITESIEFTDEQYDIAFKLYEQYKFSVCSPIMVGSDKESLIFGINMCDREIDRVSYERGDNLYKVIIKPV